MTNADPPTPGEQFRMNRVHDKVCLVTGSARGIGEACARALAGEGGFVYVSDIDHALGRRVAASLGPAGGYLELDVRDEAQWASAIARVLAERGRLDVLVNNAGITGFEHGPVPHDPEHAGFDAWKSVLNVNLDGTFLGCRHALGAMRGRTTAGSIINMSSRSGLVGVPAAAAYGASKAAIVSLTKSVALYCAQQHLPIRCNAVLPGAVLTPMWEAMLGPPGPGREAAIKDLTSDVPLGRMGTPAEVAHLVVYLASDESAYATGGEYKLDGGITAGSTAAVGKRDEK